MNEFLREGDTGFGVPDSGPAESRPLTEQEKRRYRQRDEQELRAKLEAILEADSPQAVGITIPRRLRSAVATAALCLASLLLLIVTTQVVSLWGDFQKLPEAGQYAVGAIAGLCGFALLVATLRLIVLFLRVQRTEQIPLATLKELAERGQLQSLARDREEEARKRLVLYLNEYPVTDVPLLREAGFKDEEIENLRRHHAQLIEKTSAPCADWLKEFQDTFQAILEQVARRRVRAYATKAGVVTAASPNTVLDMVLVLNLGLMMIGDLVKLYRLRAPGMATSIILAKAIGVAYLAAHVEAGVESLSEFMAEEGASQGATAVARGLLEFLSKKAAEGAANGFLMRRLGVGTIRLLQPTCP